MPTQITLAALLAASTFAGVLAAAHCTPGFF